MIVHVVQYAEIVPHLVRKRHVSLFRLLFRRSMLKDIPCAIVTLLHDTFLGPKGQRRMHVFFLRLQLVGQIRDLPFDPGFHRLDHGRLQRRGLNLQRAICQLQFERHRTELLVEQEMFVGFEVVESVFIRLLSL